MQDVQSRMNARGKEEKNKIFIAQLIHRKKSRKRDESYLYTELSTLSTGKEREKTTSDMFPMQNGCFVKNT